ncbi:GntR family transcriptional regulator [Sphingomonas sp. Leaf24]|uniref:GntR family transcriptional regulator n=1 Tax=unclassified Sphingomonas TaxID=196159 RepID=UPI0006F7763B|nr:MULTISPECIES: GntR family transcriptional regulator [unclassified Sphingomonas]KQM20321.1 GntR family transcriptional regulator [Sphingomonas sp. Leaf5]KQM96184.1 GntR family transcriptional regulator [Sphingomonas sp. Leaf24]
MTGIIIRNLSDQLVDLVRDRILAGRVEQDRAIRQDALAAELGVSKIPLREALTRLEQEGLLRSRANHGYFVRELTIDEAEEVYALRLRLEPEIAAAAAVRATEAERETATRTLARLDAATNAHGEGVGAFNRAFHLALLRPSRQPITTTVLERLHVLGERYVRKHLEPLGRDQRANDEHAELLDRWLSRDAAAVREAMYGHIEQTVVDLRREFQTDAPPA